MKVFFDSELVGRYGGRGPRYTSYPTALQFSPALTVDDYRDNAIASNKSMLPLSLYLHIPFCESLCYYCGCNKIVTRNAERVARYLAMLHREIDLQSTLFDRQRKVEQLHFGGGTPTYLDEEQLDKLMEKLADAFSFDNSDRREFSIEVDPRTVDERDVRRLARLGFSRLSLGIQDFNPLVQNAVNRIQAPEDVQNLVHAARGAGFKSLSFDLIYGLPRQTVASFDQTLETVIAMRPDRLAVYNYAHLPHRFKGQRMIADSDIPEPQVKLDILHHTIDRLGDAGYEYIGMDHFALPDDDLVRARQAGTLQRNFQGYSTHRHCDLVALGVSAIGSIGNVYSQNALTTMQYEAMLEDHRLPVFKGIAVDSDDRLRSAAIQALMCYDRLSFEEFNAAHGIDFSRYFANEIERLRPLADDGLVALDAAGITISRTGRLLLRSIAMVFDRYIDPSQNDGRFSRAI
ncbi:MAG TPA: oxygen-independent coproporphyrinogen III oxidase [Woeseiaceae bacterium]|nr:oxygen-independent coproporphyrinogen III oxidase [Woeseiaceae bacterium]